METNGQFVAQLLETSAAGFAGLTASLLFERHPEIATRYRPDGFSAWKAQLGQWLLDLAAATAASEPKLFEARMLWTRDAFIARKTSSIEDLRAALEALRDVLRERLPQGSAETAVPTVEHALAAVANGQDAQSGGSGADGPGRRALSYIEAILKGQPRQAIEQVLREVDGGAAVRDVYVEVLLAAHREVGRLWHAGDLNIAEEHVVTTTTQKAMALLCERGRAETSKDKTAVLGCVAGNVHDIGVRAISDFFDMAGWRTINLGADVPEEEFARSVRLFDADVVLLAATLDPHVTVLQRAIARVRGLEGRDVKIIVGGPVFEHAPDLWRKVGADGYSPRIEDTEKLASRLTQG